MPRGVSLAARLIINPGGIVYLLTVFIDEKLRLIKATVILIEAVLDTIVIRIL